jgi:hypothetical protein
MDAGVESMGRPGMAKGMTPGSCVDTALLEGFPAGFLKAARGHGLRGGGSVDAAATRSRQTPPGIARGDPVWAQAFPGPWWPGDVTVLPAVPVADMQEQASAGELGHSQRGSLLKPPPAGGDGGETRSVTAPADVPAALSTRRDAHDDGECLLPRWAHDSQGSPVSCEGRLEETLETAKCHSARPAGVWPDVLQGQEVLATCCLRDLLRGFVNVVRTLASGPNVPLLRPCRQAPELTSLDHSSAAFCQGYPSWDWGDGVAPEVEV